MRELESQGRREQCGKKGFLFAEPFCVHYSWQVRESSERRMGEKVPLHKGLDIGLLCTSCFDH